MKKEDLMFRCDVCGKPIKPTFFRSEYVEIRRMTELSQRKHGKSMCFACLFTAQRKAQEAGSSELCKRCTWNTYEFPDWKCPERMEIERAGLREDRIIQCTEFKALREE